MNLESVVTLAILATYLGFALLERALPGYDYPRRPLWVFRGIGWFVATFLAASIVPLWTDEWLAAHSLLDLSSLGAWGALPAFLGYQVLGYFWHRALHGVPFLWRIHQLHHAAERIDVWSAMRFHPLDIVGWTVVASVSAIFLFGVSLEAALLASFGVNAMAWFGHTNVRTPQWLGYLVARPENHALHHARGAHRKNYADLPVIDMLFGTFENPRSAPRAAGFWDGASEELGALLLGRDVAEPAAASTKVAEARG